MIVLKSFQILETAMKYSNVVSFDWLGIVTIVVKHWYNFLSTLRYLVNVYDTNILQRYWTAFAFYR